MNDIFSSDSHEPRRRGLPALVRNLAWAIAGILLALLVIANPFHVGLFETWSSALTGHSMKTVDTTASKPEGRKILFYRNPMNPTITSPVPAKDEMGMDYVPVYADEQKKSGERKILFYRNPMNPTITSPVPAKDEMGMDYVPVYADEQKTASSPGEVAIDPTVEQNMNVQTEKVERRDLTRQIRTVGYLEYDQEKMVSVTTKYPGWIEKVFINYEGEPVRRGEPLFTIYSPELVQTEQELLSAIAFAKRMGGAPDDARQRAESLVDAARARLSYWDIAPAQIDKIEKTGKAVRALVVTAPASGVVMKRMKGLEGMAVKPGMELFHIADLSTLWMSVEVFEDQLAWLHAGSHAEISLNYFPGETFNGVVRFVEPEVSEKTRTVGLKLEIPNRDGRLRSGMYATAVFEPVAVHNVVAVPSLAIIRTGQRNVVILALGGGRFAPRDVELGVQGDHYVEVRKGLEAGDTVVTSAQFLIDSESNLREAIQKFVSAKGKGAGDAQ